MNQYIRISDKSSRIDETFYQQLLNSSNPKADGYKLFVPTQPPEISPWEQIETTFDETENEVIEVHTVSSVLSRITSIQFRKGLNQAGLRNSFNEFFDLATISVQDYFDFSNVFNITDPEMIEFFSELNKTQQEIELFWWNASKI